MLGALVAPTRIEMSSILPTYPKMDGEEYTSCTEPIMGIFRSRLGHKKSFKFKVVDRSCGASFMVNVGHII